MFNKGFKRNTRLSTKAPIHHGKVKGRREKTGAAGKTVELNLVSGTRTVYPKGYKAPKVSEETE